VAEGRGGFQNSKKLFPDRITNRFQNPFGILKHDSVFEVKNLDALFHQECVALFVALLSHHVVVTRTVQLYGEFALRAEEIHDVTADAVLSTEFLSKDLALPEVTP
jgi:hypothetical protein